MRPRLLDLKGGRVLVDEADAAPVATMTGWHVNRQGYAVAFTWKPRRAVLMHRLITDAPVGTHVDHINGDKTDNRRSNLRVTTPSLNQVNRKRLNRNNTSGIRGVAYQPACSRARPWRAQIMVNKKNLHLGLFASQEEAVQARVTAELSHYGERCP